MCVTQSRALLNYALLDIMQEVKLLCAHLYEMKCIIHEGIHLVPSSKAMSQNKIPKIHREKKHQLLNNIQS